MREIKKKRRIRRILFSKVSIGVLGVLALLIASATWGVFQNYLTTRENKMNVEANVADLRERKSNLEKEIEHLETKRGVEEEIRENFGFVKEGEEVIVIVDEEEPTNEEEGEDEGGLLERFINFWKGE